MASAKKYDSPEKPVPEKGPSPGWATVTLDDIAAVIGFSATLRLVAWFGDGNLYVPATAEANRLLARLIGLERARRMSETWGLQHLPIPRLKAFEMDVLRRNIAQLLERNADTQEIAGLLKVSDRRVLQLCRELEMAGLVPPQGGPNAVVLSQERAMQMDLDSPARGQVPLLAVATQVRRRRREK